ncbi:hypothetical protein KKG22_04355 [Patescibacteria group bacterium]|nr:hypothetical protein [Patescibacteria group bacterium]MBU1721412.1 hypothetical protein [Patescibacteria group bacterium]MBU1901852.1 hypothetical protein [Patescibacteria group bacterium]
MNNKFLVTGLVLGGVALAGTTFAFQGDMSLRLSEDRDAHRASMQEVMDEKDYDGWKVLVEERHAAAEARHQDMQERHAQVLSAIDSPEDFAKMTQMHELRQSGDIEAAEVIRVELGLPEMGNGEGRKMGNRQKRDGSGAQYHKNQ